MKKSKILSLVLVLVMLVSLMPAMALADGTGDPARPELIFDPDEAYVGEFTYKGTLDGVEEIEDSLKTKAYRVTYVSNPLSDDIIFSTNLPQGDTPAGEFFKMNIIVPESFNGTEFTEEQLANAPIMIYTPWGGDRGYPVGDLSNVSVRGDRRILRMALSRGWIVIDPGMIGPRNCYTGTPDTEDFYNYAKLPYSFACMKAVIRYLRYDTNATTIPGNKEHILFMGNSSGGDMATVIGASGNSKFFEPYLKDLGAAPGRDDIYVALPSCPVMMRSNGDNGLAWELYDDLSENDEALEINKRLTADYISYLNGLGLEAEFDVPEANISVGDILTDENFKAYVLEYYKASAIRYMNEKLGSKQAVEEYLATQQGGGMYWPNGSIARSILKPVFDGDVVVDLDNTWEEIMAYNTCNMGTDPTQELNWQYDHGMMYEGVGENAVVTYAGRNFANQSSSSFGSATDYASVYSATGVQWIQDQYGVTVDDEYAALLKLQRDSTDPMYFLTEDDTDFAPYWHLRTGSVDFVVPSPNFIGLAVKLQNLGSTVDAAFMWDEGHQLTSDEQSLIAFCEQAVAEDKTFYNPIFDLEDNYCGEYSVTYGGKTYVYDAWQAKYCDTPYINYWPNSEDFYKLNVKVVKSIDGEPVDLDTATAPILFYNPWGGDNGSAVRDPGSSGSVALTWEAMEHGYVIVEPGMRGNNSYIGTIGEDDYYDYGKLPGPLADLKAALRYLRYESNADTIPGDKDHIWAAGTSSGGDATVILGASGNSPYFDEALAEINALPGDDSVFGVFPSCPVETRQWADVALAWERWGDLSLDEDAHEINRWLSSYFADYEASLGLTAEFATRNIAVGEQLTADNYAEYLMEYVKASAIKFLNEYGDREAIEEYILTDLPASFMYGTQAASRSWIKPVFDVNDQVIDIDGTWDEFWAYVVGADYYDKANEINYQYDKVMVAPDECMTENGAANSGVGSGLFAKWANASSFSFGKGGDYVSVYSPAGQDWIQLSRGIEISDEYLDLVEKQRNCTDPLYFILGEGADDADTCDYWYVRTGSIDLVTPHPIIVNLVTALNNTGRQADFAFVWEQGHGLSNDRAPFFEFADAAMNGTLELDPDPTPGSVNLPSTASDADTEPASEAGTTALPAEEPAHEETADDKLTVKPTGDDLTVDGKYVPMVSVYKIHDYNYFRLRDIAAALKDTKYSFSIGFDAETKTVYITTGKDYALLGTELKDTAAEAAEAIVSGWKLVVDGVEKTVSVYNIDGYNYYKLRDLAAVIGFGVDYNDDTNTAIIIAE